MTKHMKTRLQIVALLAVVSLGLNAQHYSTRAENNAIQSQQIMTTGSSYNGTIYEPFTNTSPSEQSNVGASYSPAKSPRGPLRFGNFDSVGEGNDKDEGSPLGDGLLPLMLMALAFTGATFLARKRSKRPQ